MKSLLKHSILCLLASVSLFIVACSSGGNTNSGSSDSTSYVLTINSTAPSSGVAITVSPSDDSGSLDGSTSFMRTYKSGTTVTLTAPSTATASTGTTNPFYSWSGCTTPNKLVCSITMNGNATVTANYVVAPTVTVTPSASTINAMQALSVTVAVAGTGTTTPSGTVILSNGSYTSASTTLADGSATFNIPAGTLSVGANTLTASYTPDTNSAATYGSATGSASVTVTVVTPVLALSQVATSLTTSQSLQVVVTVTGSGTTPTGTVNLTSGSFSSGSTTLTSGSATITLPVSKIGLGSDTLTFTYSPDSTSASIYGAASAAITVTVTAGTPAVTVSPAPAIVATTQSSLVTISVNAGTGNVTPTGAVTLSAGTYSSTATTLASGTASITVPAGTFSLGSTTLTATYAPDSASSSIYLAATGTSTLTVANSVSVDQSTTGAAVTDQILGMNMAAWYDVATNSTAIANGFQTAGIKAVRWPGGSWADNYHWSTNTLCDGNTPSSNDTFTNFVNDVVVKDSVDLALTANYGTDSSCSGAGDPTEAAAWVTAAVNAGVHVSHMTVGNEEYGSWETDLHSSAHDPATYADAVVNGYYPAIKAADSTVQVGVSVNPGTDTPTWDPTVLANAKGSYDFVEYHFYAQEPGAESDTYLVQSGAQKFTEFIKDIKTELNTAGVPDTPIYVGEVGSVYSDPGKQTTSITQALYAGQILGEMMNDGIARATWWVGFGGCSDSTSDGNFSSSLYGWQTFGGYMVFSDGLPEYGCTGAASLAAGTPLPTARAFQLFSNVAVTGESVLTPTVSGDTTDLRAYAATHSGGTALVLFNLNETTSEPVIVTLTGQTTSTGVTVITYDKTLYDQSNASTPVWAAPTTVDLGSQSLPLTLTLTPWSMNVVIIQ